MCKNLEISIVTLLENIDNFKRFIMEDPPGVTCISLE